MIQVREVPVSCNKDCGGGCPLWARVVDGRLESIGDNPHKGPYMRGCVRGYQAGRMLYAPDRLTRPLLRVGPRGSGEFAPISWEEALDRVAEGLTRVYNRYEPSAMLNLAGYGSGQGALHNSSRTCSRFLSLMGGYTYCAGSYSRGAANYAIPFVLGDEAREGMDPGALTKTSLIILWGADFYVNRFGCEWESRLKEARQRGVPVIGIDPRRSDTIRALGAEWIPILPGTDAALMQAMLYVLISENLVNEAFLARYTVGYQALRAHILGLDGSAPKTPERAAPLTGVPPEICTALARRYALAKPTALLPGLSIQRTIGGEEAIRLAIVLQAVTGNIGVPGGSTGAHIWSRLPAPRLFRLPVPAPEVSAAVPVIEWPDAVLGGRAAGYPSDIHALYNVGGNYIVQGSDMRKSIRAFEKVEFAVCHDWFLTPTARYCDIVLPATMPLEREDIVITSSNMLLYCQQAVPPVGEARDDYAIFNELARRLGFAGQYSENRTCGDWLAYSLAHSDVIDVESFKCTGIFMGREHQRSGLEDFYEEPLAHPLSTPSGKIELAPECYALSGYSAVPTARLLPPDPAHPLSLITPVSPFRTHSQGSNIAWFRDREPGGIWLHPDDAAARRISNGQLVEVFNPQGILRTVCRVTEDIMPGVVCMLHGVWPEFDANGIETAGSVNILTSTEGTLPSKSSRTHSVQVQVKALQ